MDALDLVGNGKIKRIFRARNKLAFPGAITHITQRATGKEPLFLEDADYLYMLHLLKEISESFSLEIFSFALMPNHLHLLLKLNKPNLSEAAKSLFESYAKLFNKKYERKGHVFGGAFRQALCFDDNYCLASSLYIHLNPFAANLVKHPVQYRWSSCRLFVESVKKPSFVNPEFILKILDEDLDNSRKVYRDLLKDGTEIKIASAYEKPAALSKFSTHIFQHRPRFFKRKGDEVVSVDVLNSRIDELRSKKRLRTPCDFKARKFLIEQLMARGYNINEIAAKLKINRATVYRYLNVAV